MGRRCAIGKFLIEWELVPFTQEDAGKRQRIRFRVLPPRGGSLVVIRDAVEKTSHGISGSIDEQMTVASLLEDIVLISLDPNKRFRDMISELDPDDAAFLDKTRAALKFVRFCKRHGRALLSAMNRDKAHTWLKGTLDYLNSCFGELEC